MPDYSRLVFTSPLAIQLCSIQYIGANFLIPHDMAVCQSLRLARLALSRRGMVNAGQRRSIVLVPKQGDESQMMAENIQNLRSRVQYQKELAKMQHHGHEEELTEMWRWVNISFMVGAPWSLCRYSTPFFDAHHHRTDGELPEYMKIRSKDFPWKCGGCDLFDGECWKECRAEQKK